jgi:hypothetical protein
MLVSVRDRRRCRNAFAEWMKVKELSSLITSCTAAKPPERLFPLDRERYILHASHECFLNTYLTSTRNSWTSLWRLSWVVVVVSCVCCFYFSIGFNSCRERAAELRTGDRRGRSVLSCIQSQVDWSCSFRNSQRRDRGKNFMSTRVDNSVLSVGSSILFRSFYSTWVF